MPRTEVVFFGENDGSVPLIDWLAALPSAARAKCRVRLDRLEELGHELRRPEAEQQAEVPPKDIQRAAHRKKLFEADPQRHTFVPAED